VYSVSGPTLLPIPYFFHKNSLKMASTEGPPSRLKIRVIRGNFL
jgi:hypothetical protein